MRKGQFKKYNDFIRLTPEQELRADQDAVDEASRRSTWFDISLYHFCPSANIIDDMFKMDTGYVDWVIRGCQYCPSTDQMNRLLKDSSFFVFVRQAYLIPGCDNKPDQDVIDASFAIRPWFTMNLKGGCPSPEVIVKVVPNYTKDTIMDVPELIAKILHLCGDKEVREAIKNNPDVFQGHMEKIEQLLEDYKGKPPCDVADVQPTYSFQHFDPQEEDLF